MKSSNLLPLPTLAVLCTVFTWGSAEVGTAETVKLKLRSIETDQSATPQPKRVVKDVEWDAAQTAVIVCDVWDYHHCLNAVRRLEEFAPRLDQVLKNARARGATIIHAPSDCMPAYVDHPARLRAMQAPKANPLPVDIEYWCSQLPREVGHRYPIDQSDGGEDDDPQEHATWAAKLKSLGRNPGMPWKRQSDHIAIDAQRDYVTDRGDEVWNILEQRGIRNVILTGVHCNMCVLGRPFGLRQMVRNGKQVVLMRDMTDSMYSPQRWPSVDHFAGHRLVIDYVEELICPTITSDQLLGGKPFQWKADQREQSELQQPLVWQPELNLTKHWTAVTKSTAFQQELERHAGSVWLRGAIRIPANWQADQAISFSLPNRGKFQVWLNGHELQQSNAGPNVAGQVRFGLPSEFVIVNDYNLLVVKTAERSEYPQNPLPMDVIAGTRSWRIKQGWQVRIGENPQFSNIPLPAKFGIGPDAVLLLTELPDSR